MTAAEPATSCAQRGSAVALASTSNAAGDAYDALYWYGSAFVAHTPGSSIRPSCVWTVIVSATTVASLTPARV